MRTLEFIKEQNNQILNILNNKGGNPAIIKTFSLTDLPVELPISSQEDLNRLEEFLHTTENLNNFVRK